MRVSLDSLPNDFGWEVEEFLDSELARRIGLRSPLQGEAALCRLGEDFPIDSSFDPSTFPPVEELPPDEDERRIDFSDVTVERFDDNDFSSYSLFGDFSND